MKLFPWQRRRLKQKYLDLSKIDLKELTGEMSLLRAAEAPGGEEDLLRPGCVPCVPAESVRQTPECVTPDAETPVGR